MNANFAPGSVKFRRAIAADVPALASLQLDMDAERHQIPFDSDEYIAAFLATERAEIERGAHVAWIAEADGAIVAAVLLIVSAMPPNFTELHRRAGLCVQRLLPARIQAKGHHAPANAIADRVCARAEDPAPRAMGVGHGASAVRVAGLSR